MEQGFDNGMVPLNDGMVPLERGCSEASQKNVKPKYSLNMLEICWIYCHANVHARACALNRNHNTQSRV